MLGGYFDEEWKEPTRQLWRQMEAGQWCFQSSAITLDELTHAPHGHWHTNTFIAALRSDRVEAPWLLDGPMNGEAFLHYIQEVLGPTLQPGDIVVADNLSSHKVAGVREAVAARGAQIIFLPPYSPDLNPIENFFAKLKALLRKAAERHFDALVDRIKIILENVTTEECANYFIAAGYVKA